MAPRKDHGISNSNEITISGPPNLNGNGDTSSKCRHHIAIEHRIGCCEAELDDANSRFNGEIMALKAKIEALAERIWNPKIVVAIIGLIGTIFAAAGSVLGAILVGMLKSKGYM
jgi:hypothetical protein